MARTAQAAFIPGSAGIFGTPVDRGGRSAKGKVKAGRSGVTPYFLLFLQLIAFAFLAVSVATFSASDWPSTVVYPHNEVSANWCGKVGSVAAFYIMQLFGSGTWVLLGLWGLYLLVSAFITTVTHTWVRILGALLTAVGIAGVHSLIAPTVGALSPDLGGGVVGTWLAGRFEAILHTVGSLLVMAVIVGAGLVVAVDVWVIIVPAWAFRKVRQHSEPVLEAGGAVASTMAGASVAAATVGGKGGRRLLGWLNTKLASPDEESEAELAALRPGLAARTAASVGARKGTKAPNLAVGEAIDELAGGIGGTEGFDPDEHTVISGANGERLVMAGKASGIRAAEASVGKATNAIKATKAAGGEDASGDSDDDAADDEGAEAEPIAPEPKRQFSAEELRAKIAKLPVIFASKEKKAATDADLSGIQNTDNLEGYKFPGLDLLEEPDQSYPEKLEHYVREQGASLERALREYKVDGEVVGIESGPVITLFEVRLKAGTKVAVLSGIASDLARALKAVNIRIVPNTQGRDTVGIEVPNLHKEKVRLKELMTRSDSYAGMSLPMFIGKDASGQPLIVDLASQPHMLIAGTTGSGKSVCMSAILMSFLYTRKPNELKLVLVDPKMVELSQFRDIPHLMCPVVTDMNKAAAILEWAVGKMEERYELLADAGCRDVAAYNKLSWEELKERMNPRSEQEEARIPKKLPFMVFVIDELADLMMTNKEVEHSIVRLAQKARAVGMHLIVATQRPQANVVTGLIKANMPGRVSFKVASGMDSRIVLDQKGGELLLGQGDMLYLSPKTSKLMRSQGTLVDDHEIRRVVKFLKDVAGPSFEHQLLQIRTGTAVASGLGGDEDGTENDGDGAHDGLANAQRDPLFNKAVEIVLETRKGSVSMLQRRMAIGYTRASRLIDAMGQAGIVGDHKGTVERDVHITPEEWQAMKAQAQADAQAEGDGDSTGAEDDDSGESNAQLFEQKPGSVAAAIAQDDAPFESNR